MKIEKGVDDAGQVKPGRLQESFYVVVLCIENGEHHHPGLLQGWIEHDGENKAGFEGRDHGQLDDNLK